MTSSRPDEKRYSLMELAATLDGVISLGRGDPDFATPAHILERARRHMDRPDAALHPRGQAGLRGAIADRYRETKQIQLDPESEILITNGAQEGLFLTVMALVNPGENVLVPDPRYGSYDGAIRAAGGRIVELETGQDYDFAMKPETLAAHHGDAKLLVLVNPSNPTGASTSPDRVRALSEIARERGLIVLSDEVYENLVHEIPDSPGFLSVISCEGMRERTVTLSSVSKSYAMTGFRVGYLVGPAAFIEAAAKLKAVLTGPAPLYSQAAAQAALEGPQDDVARFRAVIARRLRVMQKGLDELEIPYGIPGGGFFFWADISRYGLSAEEFCRELVTRGRVLVFPGTAFGKKWDRFVRISILQSEERLEEAVTRMKGFIKEIST